MAGVYHPSRLRVKSRCRVAVGTVSKVVFEAYDGDVHVDLRLDPAYESLLSDGNYRVGGNLVVEVIPFDRPRGGARGRRANRGRRALVEDDQHGWNEIHPAWWVSAGRIEPATHAELARRSSSCRPTRRIRAKPRGGSPQQRPSAAAWYDAERG
jgi:hypothetical protein